MKHLPDWWHILAPFHSFIAIGAGAAAVGISKWRQKLRENRAAMWPSADAEVQSVQVKHQHGSWVVVQYRYYAVQEYRYGKYRRHFSRKNAAQIFADAMRGRHMQVRYREDEPGISVVLESDLRMSGALPTS